MGVCWQSTGNNSTKIKAERITNNVIVATTPNNNQNLNSNHNTNINNYITPVTPSNQLIKKEQNQENENNQINVYEESYEESLKLFPDMPLISPEIMKGYGIKQMPGYKCDLKIDELNKLREDFWNSKNGFNRYKWKIIHQACIYDHINSEDFLYKNNIKTLKGCINMCVDEDNKIYRVPNFCINDPTFQLELLDNDDAKGDKINIFLNDVLNQKKIKFNINDNMTGRELIDKYCEQENIDKNKYNIKLIFGGGIIRDNETLYQHKVKNDYTIQICINEK